MKVENIFSDGHNAGEANLANLTLMKFDMGKPRKDKLKPDEDYKEQNPRPVIKRYNDDAAYPSMILNTSPGPDGKLKDGKEMLIT